MVTFNFTEEFLRQAKRLAKRYHSLADDIDALQHELMENPNIGISLGGGKRKIRLGVQSKFYLSLTDQSLSTAKVAWGTFWEQQTHW